jgi:L-aspartate oxidase
MIPARLGAPAPGWTARADVVVVGSGIAGLTAALHARAAGHVVLVTKSLLDAGSTRWAQGGIAAALAADDSPTAHYDDTLAAGAGLCDRDAVRVLVDEGPDRVRELGALGAAFDRDPDGLLELTREGGHLHRRIVHAGGDATGAEVERALIAAVVAAGDIEVIEHALALDLLLDDAGAASGVTLHVLGEGARDGVGALRARAVVLAAGGLGQVYASTTNPAVSTGDGLGLALRAGAAVADLEFVQFHPTALWTGAGATGRQPLVTEALRGEGAVLVDAHGQHVMAGVHPLGDLAPRDVVAKQMSRVMAAQGVDHLYLDVRGLGADLLRRRFPTLLANCVEIGVDPLAEPVPVAPAAHYASGGVRTDIDGATSVRGLYACGEVACTGVHGANRLASNSLLEGLVFATRIARALMAGLPSPGEPAIAATSAWSSDDAVRPDLQRAMTEGAGVLRNADGLSGTQKALEVLADRRTTDVGPESWETTNLLSVATALTAAAARREETRGCHWREDYPETDPRWQARLVQRLARDGSWQVDEERVP